MAAKAKSSKRPHRPRVHRGTMPSRWATLQEGVRGCFPAVEPRALGTWLDALAKAKVEPEFFLFVVLVCGVQFQVYRMDPKAVADELRAWLVSPPRLMRAQLADVMTNALAPAIERTIDDQWKGGPEGKAIDIGGRPPDTRAAWAAAAVVEEILAQRRVPVDDRERMNYGLLELLLGRTVGSREYDGRWRATGGSRPLGLAGWLSAEYERLVEMSARRQYEHEAAARPSDWRKRHRALTHLFAVDGFEAGARSVAVSVPPGLWDSLAGVGGRPSKVGHKRGT